MHKSKDKESKKYTSLAKKLVIKQVDNSGFKNKFVKIHFVFSSLAVVALAGFIVFKAQQSPMIGDVQGVATQNTQQTYSQDSAINMLMNSIKLEDSNPTVYTIADIDKLKEDPFYKRAELKDKLFVFNKDNMAVIFRPSINKIINASYLQDEVQSTASPSAKTKLAPKK